MNAAFNIVILNGKNSIIGVLGSIDKALLINRLYGEDIDNSNIDTLFTENL